MTTEDAIFTIARQPAADVLRKIITPLLSILANI